MWIYQETDFPVKTRENVNPTHTYVYITPCLITSIHKFLCAYEDTTLINWFFCRVWCFHTVTFKFNGRWVFTLHGSDFLHEIHGSECKSLIKMKSEPVMIVLGLLGLAVIMYVDIVHPQNAWLVDCLFSIFLYREPKKNVMLSIMAHGKHGERSYSFVLFF